MKFRDRWSDMSEAAFDKMDEMEDAYHVRKEREREGHPSGSLTLPPRESSGPFAAGTRHESPRGTGTRIPRLPMPMLYDHLLHAIQLITTALISLAFAIPVGILVGIGFGDFGLWNDSADPGPRVFDGTRFATVFLLVFALVPAVFAIRIGTFVGVFLGMSARNLSRFFLITLAAITLMAAVGYVVYTTDISQQVRDLNSVGTGGIASFRGPILLPAAFVLLLTIMSEYARALRGGVGNDSWLPNAVRLAVVAIAALLGFFGLSATLTQVILVSVVIGGVAAIAIIALTGITLYRAGSGY